MTPAAPIEIVNALYSDFFERGVLHFFPDSRLQAIGRASHTVAGLRFHHQTDGTLELEWCGTRYRFATHGKAVTESEQRLIAAIGDVLSARYRSIFVSSPAASMLHLFRGLPEDRFVSAYLVPGRYLDQETVPTETDVIAEAIEVMRESSLITYENRRISTGALLLGTAEDPLHPRPRPSLEALPYNRELIGIKSFHRLCDGINTVFLVSHEGLLLDLIDVREWNRATCGRPLPAPTASKYNCHSIATLSAGHIALVLTPNGEIKILAEGTQVFNFLGGRWRLTDMAEKYHRWHRAVSDSKLAERLFAAALNLAENRRGGLFVVLDDPRSAAALVAPSDLLGHMPDDEAAPPYLKSQLHYLLRGKRIPELEPAVLESIARMDGGIVLDPEGRLLAFGAILRNEACGLAPPFAEGGRSTAAMSSSRFGHVLKVSEDGLLTYYRDGVAAWEI